MLPTLKGRLVAVDWRRVYWLYPPSFSPVPPLAPIRATVWVRVDAGPILSG